MKEILRQISVFMRYHPPITRVGTWFNQKATLVLCVLLLACTSVLAQGQVQVTGRVTDATGQPLPGVTVRVKGGTAAAATGADGKYRIGADAGGTLVYSFIGFVTQEVRVNSQTVIDVQLRDDQRSLNEVVVIGYQTIRKRDVTGAVSTINTGASAEIAANSVGQTLQGLSPGVTVRNAGAPGGAAEVEIRGIGSFLQTNPLYVIDGMIADANNITINTDDIESMQILKDASAAAIYGSRAANGVIIITTKQGKKGPPKIQFSAKVGAQQLPKKWNVMNSTQYAATKRQEYTNSGLAIPASVGSAFNPAINTDWQDLDERTGNQQDYNLSISGGSDNSRYLISGSYYENQGAVKANSLNRSSLRVNTETKKGILTFGENAAFSYSQSYHPNRGNPFYDLPTSLPTVPVQDNVYIDNSTAYPTLRSARNPWGYSTGVSPYDLNATTALQDQNYSTNMIGANSVSQGYSNFSKIVGNAYAQLRLADWLDYKFNVGIEASFDYNRDLRKDGILTFAQQQELSYIDEDRERFSNLLMEHTLNFNKTFGKHNINGVVGFSTQRGIRTYTDARRTALAVVGGEYLTSINSATGNPSANGGTGGYAGVGSNDDFKLISYLGRLNYTYNDKYLLTLTGRVDQDSRFGPDNRTGFFPSIAGAWRINRESFFKADWVNDLKLNASYGVLGINTIGPFTNLGYVNNAPRAVYAGDVIVNGAYQAALFNPDVRWESRYETNIGFDATVLNHRLNVAVSVYNNTAKNALVPYLAPSFLGALGTNVFINAGSIRNRGLEFEATYRNNDNKFKWSVSGNFTTIQNRVLAVGNQGTANYILTSSADIGRFQVGHSVGSWFLLKDIGIFQSQAEINSYRRANGDLIQPNAKPGDIKFYADPNGAGAVSNNDRVFVGSALPTLQTGLQFSGSYKQFSANLQLTGVFGNKVFNDVRTRLDSYQNNNMRADINPWTPTNTNTTDPRLGIATGDPGIVLNNTYNSSRWLENGSYGRIRNLEFGYTLPATLVKHWHMDSARIFISGQNLLTVTKYKGLDPDVTGVGATLPGFDNGAWPSSRIYSIGINCGF